MTGLLKRAEARGRRSAELPILFENYLKVIRLNVFTGEFHYIKTYRGADRAAGGSFYEYADRAVSSGLIHKDDAEYFRRYLYPGYLPERLSGGAGGKRIVLHGLRYRILTDYETVDFEMLASKSFSRENPQVLLCITCTEKCRSSIGTAVIPAYCKIIYVRISDGYSEPVYITDSEIGLEESLTDPGNVDKKDRERFLRFIEKENLKKLLYENGEAALSYRRLIDGKSRPVTMRISKCGDRAFIYLYESDSRGKYTEKRRTTEKYFDGSDILTGIRNSKCFDEKCGEYDRRGRREPVGVMYAILPEQSGEEGTEQLRTFAISLMEKFGRKNCYRTGEREFAVISSGTADSFVRQAEKFADECCYNVTTGICGNEAAKSIYSLYEDAKKAASAEKV